MRGSGVRIPLSAPNAVNKNKISAGTGLSGRTITNTVLVPEADVLQTTRTGYALTRSEFDILLMQGVRNNLIFEISIGAVIMAALSVTVATLKWLGDEHQTSWWEVAREHVWLLILAAVLSAGSWFTLRSGHDPRTALVNRLKDYFDATG